jgi:fatty-acyl-CoA synthase
MEKETEESFKGGRLHTGDMAYIDDNGNVTLMGRKKEMYVQGGFNVHPVEIENILSKHPKILMVAGIGVPDPVLGEVGRYYIIPKPGMELTEKEIKEYCRQNMADCKVPRQIAFRRELPLSPAGKVMKTALKEEYEKTGK